MEKKSSATIEERVTDLELHLLHLVRAFQHKGMSDMGWTFSMIESALEKREAEAVEADTLD